MKKFIIISVVLITIISCSAVMYGGTIVEQILYVKTSSTADTGEPVLEADKLAESVLVKTILKETYATEMLFKGDSNAWNVNFIVDKIISIEDASEKAEVILTTKKNYSGLAWLHIKTTQGTFSKNVDVKDGKVVLADNNLPIPIANEAIKITIVYGDNMDSILLANKYPEGIISPDSALVSALVEYKEVYKSYPTSEYTFELDIINDNDWLVSYDDNDGIGGKEYIIIDGTTGISGDIKVEEYSK